MNEFLSLRDDDKADDEEGAARVREEAVAPPSSTSLMPFTLVPPHSPTTGLVSPGNGVN